MSRLKFLVFTALLILLTALAVGCGGNASQEELQAPREQPDARVSAKPPGQAVGQGVARPGAGVWVIQATVTAVSNGDTIHVSLNGRDERVRMIGVNCPEIAHPDLGIKEQPYGREAKAYTERLLSGKKVWLEFDIQQRDKYGKLLAYVWLEPPSFGSADEVRKKMFNARLLL